MQSEMEVVLQCENYVQADALTVVDLACEQALLFGREKRRVSRERASERRLQTTTLLLP